jgi:hypothetical protein
MFTTRKILTSIPIVNCAIPQMVGTSPVCPGWQLTASSWTDVSTTTSALMRSKQFTCGKEIISSSFSLSCSVMYRNGGKCKDKMLVRIGETDRSLDKNICSDSKATSTLRYCLCDQDVALCRERPYPEINTDTCTKTKG